MPARVLLYDAHPLLRRGLAAALADGSYDVCADTGDADDALALAERARPALAVVGVTMPSAVGLSLVRRLARSGVRVVVLADHDEPLYAERALRSGARGYLGRNTEVADLHAALREVEAGGVALSGATTERLLQQLPARRAEPGRVPVDVLSHREIEVFELTGLGLNRREIAGRLALSTRTVDSYRTRMKEKLSLGSMSELVRHAVRWVESERGGAPSAG